MNEAINSTNFKDIFSDENAFYKVNNYLETTKADFARTEVLPVSYVANTEHRIWTAVKDIFSYIIFPVKIYNSIHSYIAGFEVLPSASPESAILAQQLRNKFSQNLDDKDSWKYKRFTVGVDGYLIDAMVMCKPETLTNGRWVLDSNGNMGLYEGKLTDNNFKSILSKINGNAIVFNYPGVAVSSGMPGRPAMAKAYNAMLRMLEDQEKGIGAKEIIGHGLSIGGGVQGDGLNTHELRKDLNYVFVKIQTFSDFESVVSELMGKTLAFLSTTFGWNFRSVESSKNLQAPEIILQTSDYGKYTQMTTADSHRIIDDGVIGANPSLAKVLLEDDECPKDNKLFIGIPERHGQDLRLHTIDCLARDINLMLSKGNALFDESEEELLDNVV